MHKSVVFINFRSISFTCKPSQALLKYIHSKRFITSYENVYSEVKLVSIDQERVSYIPGNHRGIIYINIVYVIYEVNAFSLGGVGWFNDPNILFRVMLF